MARGRSEAGVKSHRRGRRKRKVKRRLPVAPWIVITVVVTLVASGMVAGYWWLLGTGCSGDPIKAVVAAPDTISNTLSKIARDWENTEPSVNGRCVGVDIKEKSSAEVVNGLSGTWDAKTEGPAPHIWVPESSAWLQMAKLTDAGDAMIPNAPPLAATSPTVIAMPAPAAKALGWNEGGKPKADAGKPTWENLVKLASSGRTWKDFGHPEWGDIKVGMSSPGDSTADLHALLSVVDANRDGTASTDELDNVSALHGVVSKQSDSIDDTLGKMSDTDAKNKPMGYVSAFPALERDVWQYNSTAKTHLTAVYPSDGSIDADYPMAILQKASWTNHTFRDIGRQFAEYVIGHSGQESMKQAGFRDGTRRTGSKELTGTDGLASHINEPQRKPVKPETVQDTLVTWKAQDVPMNVLVVVDSSSSMGKEVTYNGKKTTRLAVVQKELSDALRLFGSQANVGIWRYSVDGVTGESHTPVQDISKFTPGNKSAALDNLTSITPAGDGGLYQSAVDAYQALVDYQGADGAANRVVLLSDGGNEDGSAMSEDQMVSKLQDLSKQHRSKSARIETIGYGDEVNSKGLEDIASATQGQYYPAKWSDEINSQLLSALFSS
ncbi:MAG TPA: substrate-binding domain-containing protein [Stackebrandtia sp.]|jgi:Ca-activated chloride channel family protein|uniref:vWA domain-containing protein n=1 Tax=Stackebrandtia sp. TaxID=2023065 RepID=UPI002D570C94|nr:substrate-binding domain-containing protein [Stackebrandtia sp.]HZE37192.1 substrate-binding domain-containing protein [Stackebrandtia sp.]